jgi:hypothetical protein
MVDADLVGRKIAIARSRLADADQLREQAQRGGTTHDRDLASFYVFLAIQEAIDLAAHWVADGLHRTKQEGRSTFSRTAAPSSEISPTPCARPSVCATASPTATAPSITSVCSAR